ncbi:CidA/LrgA family protein [Thiomicrorhabdus sp. ZW0627]|uniref:CidA/LrgA family protein n=1 Tax=Thiomicrorhabdus sp. ZW0627 TaxID=3039774 RepID=UPI002436C819|nr:CidA/LrgA family protein [Thiomicrorhabdus sp. ZW0627]MDG6774658.1 CidA/LrgA family protein [Thiomicrorhabdus sp. ZW0627]
MPFLNVITILLVYQLVGELTVREFDWPVPGPVIGMLLLLVTLLIKRPIAEQLVKPTEMLLSHFSLLFIPAGVGLMIHLTRLRDEWLAITVALLVSTVLGLLVTAWTMMLMTKLMNRSSK